ncbi:hypothetical protein L083_5081 [Actinoplanes sp. N902-109]|nr:hypothetical protein L083_5081 [Actinoplanes sp. N902-109]
MDPDHRLLTFARRAGPGSRDGRRVRDLSVRPGPVGVAVRFTSAAVVG